jgi:hypothetical protein
MPVTGTLVRPGALPHIGSVDFTKEDMQLHRRHALSLVLAAPFLIRASDAQAESTRYKIRELYNKDRSFSDLANGSVGQRISMEGFMAPPLKANSNFFVLTKLPMSVCPFCESEAEWPRDILAVYTKRVVDVIPFNIKIETRGVFEIGPYTDPDTGFVSMARLMDSSFERA